MDYSLTAQTIFDGKQAKTTLEDAVFELLEAAYAELDLDFELCFDEYDRSVEIDLDTNVPYPWEPSMEIRRQIEGYGFSTVLWNFPDGGEGIEEIRGNEPRRIKRYKPRELGCGMGYQHIHYPGIGYVDRRFNEEKWMQAYGKFRADKRISERTRATDDHKNAST